MRWWEKIGLHSFDSGRSFEGIRGGKYFLPRREGGDRPSFARQGSLF